MINLYNAQQFLEAGKYEPPNLSSAKPAAPLAIRRTIGKPAGKAVAYEVTDKPPSPAVRPLPLWVCSGAAMGGLFCWCALHELLRQRTGSATRFACGLDNGSVCLPTCYSALRWLEPNASKSDKVGSVFGGIAVITHGWCSQNFSCHYGAETVTADSKFSS
jgi:hypothetical protein